jgi:hypothetical protein
VIDLAFACPGCGKPVEGTLEPTTSAMTCPACARSTPLPEAAATAASGRPGPCTVCGSPDLYTQRDFNRGLGIALVAVGMLLGPLTSWISVGVAVLADAVLYLLVPSVSICYACNAQYRGVEKENAPPGFEIALHDVYKFARRFPPRRDAAVAGPLAARLARESPPGPR